MQSLYDVPAPAKLNLFLHVTGRRADGYHLLQSVFMLIDWCDTLHFELRPNAQISREDLSVPLPADDLVLRAAKALQAASGTRCGAHICIDKRIPAQAGLGGGSSDAASTLLALNRLWQLHFSLQQLNTLALSLGADVPFFLLGRHAWVQGIGEHLSPIDLEDASFLVVKPLQGLPTQAIFASSALKRDSETATISGFAKSPFTYGRNDLQSVAQALCPGIGQAIGWLETLGLQGRMTGSGSAVFAVTSPQLHMGALPQDMEVRLCRNLRVHPLAGWAENDVFFGGQS
jgi:4-diphosphocytidyl-2-C-methyl-D-erythritol kinase